ncbi:MAG: hypothetical protein Q9195_005298 [Heterodermia aff. obscurata]
MDPLSVAGLGLGALSLAFQLFAGCIKGFVLLSTAQHIGKDSSTLVCMLNLQEIQLTEWARRACLLSVPHELDRRLNGAIVQAVLKELESLLLDTEKLKSRYNLGFQAASFSATASCPPVSPSGGILDLAISDETRRDVLFKARLIQNRNTLPQRLRWATVDKSKFEEYVDQIRMFVQELWRLLDPLRQDEMVTGLQQVLSHVVGMSHKLEELNALKDTLENSSIISGSSSSGSPNAPLASAAAIKAFTLGFGDAAGHVPSAAVSSHIPQLRPDKTAFQLISTEIREFTAIQGNPDMGIAKYEETVVFVERKGLPVHSRSKIMGRVQDLAILLGAPKHPEFRALRCKGIALETSASRIAYVFEMPGSSTFQPPVSLKTYFKGNPSVTDRLKLALRITQSVRYFHMAGWLHKNLRSENIILFSPFSLAHPTLAGFTFSRQDSPSQISEQPSADPQRDIYRHPDAMGEPAESFSVAKDVYALGTILLEIGEWRSLKYLVEQVVDLRKSDIALVQLAKIQPFLLDENAKGGLATLRFRMGDIYAAVTKMMLTGEIPRIFTLGKEEVQGFAPNVLDIAVRELGRCIV